MILISLTLVLLAAGRGSRFGGPKQLMPFGPSGELIMDYAIADAVDAGFSKIVLVIRREMESDFAPLMAKHAYADRFELEFAFQAEALGTGDAARSAASAVKGPSAIINSDDYYGGKEIYRQAADFLRQIEINDSKLPLHYGILGYPLQETIYENSSVSRGICSVEGDSKVVRIVETFEIHREADGIIYGSDAAGDKFALDDSSVTSMTFWLFPKAFYSELDKDFAEYMASPRLPGRAGEFLLTNVVDKQMQRGAATVFSIPVKDSNWCGVTSPEDRPMVEEKLAKLHENGMYGRLRLA